jgi:hypothetical protein
MPSQGTKGQENIIDNVEAEMDLDVGQSTQNTSANLDLKFITHIQTYSKTKVVTKLYILLSYLKYKVFVLILKQMH